VGVAVGAAVPALLSGVVAPVPFGAVPAVLLSPPLAALVLLSPAAGGAVAEGRAGVSGLADAAGVGAAGGVTTTTGGGGAAACGGVAGVGGAADAGAGARTAAGAAGGGVVFTVVRAGTMTADGSGLGRLR